MMDFLRLAILPDELARAYKSRLARVNGWDTADEATKKLSQWVSTQIPLGTELSGVEVLAYVAAMDITSFVRSHTMLPFQRAVVSTLEDVPHGCADRRSLLEKRAYCATRKRLYFCRACVNEDVDSRVPPYWRRTHQLPGMLWCPKHETPLTSAESNPRQLLLPQDCLTSGVDVSHAQFITARSNPNVLRYLEICLDMLVSEHPIHESHISKAIRSRAKEIQEQSGGQATFKLRSSGLKSMFDIDWLGEIFTHGSKSSDEAFNAIDNLFKRGIRSLNSVGYALLLACLYETSDEAMYAISGLPKKSRRKSRSADKTEAWDFDQKSIRDSYLAERGNQVSIAKSLGLTRPVVKSRLRMLGLPPLGRNDVGKMKSLVTQLLEGQIPLAKICADHGLQLNDTSHRLREALGPLLDAISKLNSGITTHKKRGSRPTLQVGTSSEKLQAQY